MGLGLHATCDTVYALCASLVLRALGLLWPDFHGGRFRYVPALRTSARRTLIEDGAVLDPRLPLTNTAGTVWYRTQPKSTVKGNSIPQRKPASSGWPLEMRVFRNVSLLLAHWCFAAGLLADFGTACATCRTKRRGLLVL